MECDKRVPVWATAGCIPGRKYNAAKAAIVAESFEDQQLRGDWLMDILRS